MERSCMKFLVEWIDSADRLPLIIQGARQVGKTWLVRHLAKSQNRDLVELNIEDRRSLATHFSTNDVTLVLASLSAVLGKDIDPKRSLLFVDEIQAAPELISKLRWFAEKMPELPVVAAGSLLEFALENYSMSMPVGRIEYLYIEPFSFEEFLMASNKMQLVKIMQTFTWKQGITQVVHEELMRYVKEYLIIGGMPAAVKSWVHKKSLQELARIHDNLITTYQNDFSKYGSRIDSSVFEDVLTTVPKMLGEKFVYAAVNPDVKTEPVKTALTLLCRARVCHKVTATSANGIPLKAELKPRYIKVILLDVGLCSAALDLSLDQVLSKEIDLINKGGISEQLVGQLLRTVYPFHKNPALYYWVNTSKKSSAEIDYVIQHRGNVVPIEVKAGKTGTLKSLQQFMGLKKLEKALRINSDIPSIVNVEVKNAQGER